MNITQKPTAETTLNVDMGIDRDWWRGAVIYQIYPRSFQDTNGDGIGDLRGIQQRLPYIASLGVDAIWISPFFKSPMKDFGYDVSDYCDVDPIFGTLEDFNAVVDSAHKLGLKVMIDLVLSHTADTHPWFSESRVDRHNAKSDWYVWADPNADGTPPNNWLSVFGGSAWQWDARREQYFLHNFLSSQPDLNFHNHAVQDALLDVTRFWLNLGVDGFRLDTINFYFADKGLRNNPALLPEDRNSHIAPLVNPYNYQEHIYSKNQPENLDFLRRFRAVLEEYPATTLLGEVGDAQFGLEILGQYTAGDDLVHMCYAFEFLSIEQLTATSIADVFKRLQDVAKSGWACWAFSNHDVMRHSTRWDLSPVKLRLHTALMMGLRGSVCLYQGEELGFPEAELEYGDLQDPYGIEFWPKFKGRDGCRTPIAWDNSNRNGGASTGKTWLPVAPEHLALSVDRQENDADSLLNYYRRAIAFRGNHPALSKGAIEEIKVIEDTICFMRSFDNEEIFCAFNIGDTPLELDLPVGEWKQIGTDLGSALMLQNGKISLGPWQPCFALKTIK